MKKYVITINAHKSCIEAWTQELGKMIVSSNLSDLVTIYNRQIRYVDYGVNPMGDADTRPFVRVRNPQDEEIFQKCDFLYRGSNIPAYKKAYLCRIIQRIERDLVEKKEEEK